MPIRSDVQNRRMTGGFVLTRVGVTGVRKPVRVTRAGRQSTLFCAIDVFVDLPAEQKGSHLSRNLEAIDEAVKRSMTEGTPGIEAVAGQICRALREKHEYSTSAEVRMTAEYFLERPGPSGRISLEPFRIMAGAVLRGDDELRRSIGVEVVGMTACPCAMETVRDIYKKTAAFEDDLPVITHNQRNVVTITIETPGDLDVEANELIEVAEESFSSPTYELLKRSDEAAAVLSAHRNPRFVEDVVRAALTLIVARWPDLPDSASVMVRSESEESIHKHNASAERSATMRELRQ